MNNTTTLPIIIGAAIVGPLVLAAVIAGVTTWLNRQVSASAWPPAQPPVAAPSHATGPKSELRVPVWIAVALAVVIVLGPWYIATQLIPSRPEAAPSAPAGGAPAATAPAVSQPAAAPGKGDAVNGEKVFNTQACNACHSLKEGEKIVGPSLYHVGQTAANRIKDSGYRGKAKTAEEYLRESMVDPNVYIVPGYAAGIMIQDFGKKLNAQELEDVIAFLTTK